MVGGEREKGCRDACCSRVRVHVRQYPKSRRSDRRRIAIDLLGLARAGQPAGTRIAGHSRAHRDRRAYPRARHEQASTRKAAEEAANKPGSTLSAEPDAQTPGLREWLTALGRANVQAAVFDTRIKMPAVLSGRASRGIAKELRRHGVTLLTKPESFLVSKDNQLLPGEEDRARIWGQQLARPSLALPIPATLPKRDSTSGGCVYSPVKRNSACQGSSIWTISQ